MFCRAACRVPRVVGWRTSSPAAGGTVRHLSFGVPASGTNLAFMFLGGGSLTAALVYAYKMVRSDSQRYSSRIADMEAKFKGQQDGELSTDTRHEVVTTPVGDPVPVAVATTLNSVAEAITVETEVAPGPDLEPDATKVVAVIQEPIAEVAAAIAAEAPQAGDAAELVVVTVAAGEEAEMATAEPASHVAAEIIAMETKVTTAMETMVIVTEVMGENLTADEDPAA